MLERLLEYDNVLFEALNGSDSLYWDAYMWVVTKTQTWIPLLLVILFVVARRSTVRRTVLFVVFFALAILFADQLSSGLIKPWVQRCRPTHAATFVHSIDTVFGNLGGRYGFVSSHAANTFAVALYLSLLFRHTPLSVLLFAWALTASYSRVYLGVHYPGDILCGGLLGLMVGGLVYLGFTKADGKINTTVRHYAAENYTSTGFPVVDMELVMAAIVSVFALVFVAAVFVGNS